MRQHLKQLKERLGPLWWYAAILFCVQRAGDVLNVIIGLWLVPKYVPAAELGAVLPLAQVGGVLGLPMAIMLIPFGKFVNVFAVREEWGKIKALLRDVFLWTASVGIVLLLSARWLLPGVFSQMRIQTGLLPWLVIASGITTAIAPLFLQALQGLKKFRSVSLATALTAPVRLLVLAVTLPIRGLSGYFTGQLAADSWNIMVSLVSLRKVLSRTVVAQAYWGHWREISVFVLPVGLSVIARRLQAAAEFFIIRHSLSDWESGGYYFLTRFAEMPVYLWGTMGMVLLPLVSERHERQEPVKPMLRQMLTVLLVSGVGLVILLHYVAPYLFAAIPACLEYRSATSLMGVATLTSVLRAAVACLITYELACRRYRFVIVTSVIALVEALALYLLAAPTDWLSRLWVHITPAGNSLDLKTVVWLMSGFHMVIFAVYFWPQRTRQ